MHQNLCEVPKPGGKKDRTHEESYQRDFRWVGKVQRINIGRGGSERFLKKNPLLVCASLNYKNYDGVPKVAHWNFGKHFEFSRSCRTSSNGFKW